MNEEKIDLEEAMALLHKVFGYDARLSIGVHGDEDPRGIAKLIGCTETRVLSTAGVGEYEVYEWSDGEDEVIVFGRAEGEVR